MQWRYRRLAAQGAAVVIILASVAGAQAQTTVRIGLAVPNFGPYAPVHAAEDLGLYKANGVKPEITAYRGGAAGQEALAAGAADMISFFPPGRRARDQERNQGKDRRHRLGDAARLAYRGDEQLALPDA